MEDDNKSHLHETAVFDTFSHQRDHFFGLISVFDPKPRPASAAGRHESWVKRYNRSEA